MCSNAAAGKKKKEGESLDFRAIGRSTNNYFPLPSCCCCYFLQANQSTTTEAKKNQEEDYYQLQIGKQPTSLTPLTNLWTREARKPSLLFRPSFFIMIQNELFVDFSSFLLTKSTTVSRVVFRAPGVDLTQEKNQCKESISVATSLRNAS